MEKQVRKLYPLLYLFVTEWIDMSVIILFEKKLLEKTSSHKVRNGTDRIACPVGHTILHYRFHCTHIGS